MTGDLSWLKFSEDVRLHPDTLLNVPFDDGDDGTHDVIERTVVKVAERMGAVEQAVVNEDMNGLREAALSLGEIGDQLGFMAMSRVSQDVVYCIEHRAIPAINAVAERLIRVGDASLTAAIENALPP